MAHAESRPCRSESSKFFTASLFRAGCRVSSALSSSSRRVSSSQNSEVMLLQTQAGRFVNFQFKTMRQVLVPTRTTQRFYRTGHVERRNLMIPGTKNRGDKQAETRKTRTGLTVFEKPGRCRQVLFGHACLNAHAHTPTQRDHG